MHGRAEPCGVKTQEQSVPLGRKEAPRQVERVLLVATPDLPHVGWSLIEAGRERKLALECMDQQQAFRASGWVRRFCWWLLQRRPARLHRFSREVERRARELRPDCVVTTGCAPLDARALQNIRAVGTRVVNFSTDDPWNRNLTGDWFRRTLPFYDTVFTPRRANSGDFQRLGCRDVRYLPFAYDPKLHFIEPPSAGDPSFECDLVFVGGADADRLPWVRAVVAAGLDVHLWGGYWQKHPEFQMQARGMTDSPAVLRRATSGARLVLCLVRRANRDGHAMRTFEVPAMGGCMLAEDTAEHRELLGPDGECAAYFSDTAGLIKAARRLLGQPAERARMAAAAYARITGGGHTYADRLRLMLEAT